MRNAAKTALLGVAVLVCAVVALKGSVLQVASGMWAPTANLAQPSAGASAALLQDGRILITGGDAGNGALVSADLFNMDGSVSPAAPMNGARSKHVSVTLQDGRVLVAGGTVLGGGATNAAEIYDPIADTWTSLAGGMIEARSGATAALLQDGRAAIAGGQNGNVASSTIEIFDPVAGSFSFAGTLSSPREQHAMAVLADGRVIIIGGSDGTIPVASTDILDPVAGSVAVGPSLATPRSGHSATTLLDGRVLVAGGNHIVTNADGTTTPTDLASAEIFDPSTDTFSVVASALTTARQGHQAFLLPHNGNVLIVGGTFSGTATASAELYTPWTGAISATSPMSTARSQATGGALSNGNPTSQNDGLLLVAGGTDASSPAKTLAGTELYGFATVKTDQSDYAPGTTVTITGTGWKPGETVTLSFLESPLIDTHPTLTAIADANGNITNNQFSPDIHDVNVRFYLTATGSASQAQTTFTDAPDKVGTVSVSAQSGTLAYGTPGSATYTVTVTRGNNGAFTANLNITGLPAGTSFSFSPASLSFPTNSDTSHASTLTVTTTAAAQPGATTFTVTAANSGNSTDNVSNTGTLTIGKATVTAHITANNKTYDGTTTATLSSQTLTGVVGTDLVNLVVGAANFDTKNVGTGKTVTATSLTLSGANAGNYVLSSPSATTTANITTRTLHVTATADNKIYDGTVTEPNTSIHLSDDRVSGDILTVSFTSAAFPDKNVGNSKTVTVSGLSISSGSDAGNYTLNSVTQVTTTANIAERALHVTATADNKIYDGTATEPNTSIHLSDDRITGDVLTVGFTSAAFPDKNVGTAKVVTVSGLSITGGADAANYTLNSITQITTAANITALHITGSFTVSSKTYDGTNSATVLTRSLNGAISGDIVSLTGGTATFSDKTVANGKTVTLTGASLTGTDAGNYILDSVATTTANITALHITGSFTAGSKIYDGNASATVLTRSLIGAISGDMVSLTGGTASFSDKTVANGKTVTLTGASLTGTDAGNYILDSVATTTANITALHITGSFTAGSKIYDGNASATVLTRSLIGAISGDMVSLTGGTASFSDKTVANGKTVTLTGASLTGTDAGNYILDSVATTTANITALHITGSFTAGSKIYDGNASATVLTRSLIGAISGDMVSLTGGTASFSDKTVANGKTVTLTGASLTGADAGNYALDSVGTTTANITALHITGSFTAGSKIYDGNASATVLTRSLIGAISGDMVSLTGGTASFSDKTVANGKTVTLTGASLTGTDAGNYILDSVATTTANITALHITGSFTAGSKIYDGNASATVLTRSLIGAISGDMVSLTGGTASFSDKTVANGKTVTLTGASLTGTDAGNYILDSVATTTANITALHITGSFTAGSKIYDGNASATVLMRSLIGAISGDMVSLTGGTASFSDKTVANGKTVTLTGASLTGTDAENYILDSVATTTANITALHITGSFTAGSKIYDGNASAMVLTRSLIGAISGDMVSLTGGTASFSDKTVANGKTVTLTGASLTGTDAGNYILDSVATTTANITALHITGSFTAGSKTYDGNASATVLTETPNGIISPDMVTLAGGTASFSDKTVANGKTVTLTGASLTGTDAGNYILDSVATTTANITALHITGSFTAGSKIYDGNASATVLTRSLIGAISGDMVSLTGGTASFSDKTVANGKTVTLTGASLTGTDAGNYILDSVATTTANITALHITGSFTAGSKTYDGNASATVLTETPNGIISPDMVTLAGGTASFSDKTVANGKTVALTGASLTGADASNYILDSVATTMANITALHITGSFTASSKIYDGNASATVLTRSLIGAISADVVSLTGGTATFADKNVGMGKVVTLTGASLSGADAGDYILDSVGTTTANITPAPLTAAVTADAKQYDGNTMATLHCTLPTGVFSGDMVNCSATGAFASKDVATPQTVNLTNIILGGAQADDYSLSATTGTTSANITPITVTAAVTADAKQYDGNTTATLHCSLPSGVLSGDMVNCSATGAFASKNVATPQTVNTTNIILGGAQAGDYSLTTTTGTTSANITSVPVTATLTAANKTYDGTATEPNANMNCLLTGVLSGDSTNVSCMASSGTFDGPNVGVHTVTALVTIMGTAAGNYTLGAAGTALSSVNATASANIAPAATSTSVSSSANPSALSQVVTFTAVVKNTQTSPTPTGSVQFIIDGSNSGGPVVLSGGTASVSTSTLSVGPHSVVALYTNSDGNFVGSTSSTLTQQVNYGFLGFGAPYAPPPTAFNVTRTMPLKWQYTNSSGAVVNSAAANPVVIINGPYPCGGSDTAGTITVNDAGASGYQYDPGSNSWQFNWQIKGSVVGCYDIYVKSQQSGQTTGPSPISVVNK